MQRLHSAEDGSLAKVAQAIASLIARSEPAERHVYEGSTCSHAGHTVHRHGAILIRICFSLSDGKHISAPRRFLFISLQQVS
jgi:hypothetical protein